MTPGVQQGVIWCAFGTNATSWQWQLFHWMILVQSVRGSKFLPSSVCHQEQHAVAIAPQDQHKHEILAQRNVCCVGVGVGVGVAAPALHGQGGKQLCGVMCVQCVAELPLFVSLLVARSQEMEFALSNLREKSETLLHIVKIVQSGSTRRCSC